jgi:hypothetical protein
MNKHLCQAVDCLSIPDHICKCLVHVDGKDIITEIRFCHEHFLMQKALDYHRKESK